MVTVVYNIGSEICGSLPPKKFCGPKTSKFRPYFGQFRDMIANISRLEQDIVDGKTALQTAITPLRAHQIWWTLVHKRRKVGPGFRPTQNQLFRTFISHGLRGVAPKKFTVGTGCPGVVPSERNPVRTKAVFDLMEHRFSFCRDFVLTGFRSIGIGRFVSFCYAFTLRTQYMLFPLFMLCSDNRYVYYKKTRAKISIG